MHEGINRPSTCGAHVAFSALADRTRLKILHALKDGEDLCVCDVAHVLEWALAVFRPRDYDCLGRAVCYPALAANAFAEASQCGCRSTCAPGGAR